MSRHAIAPARPLLLSIMAGRAINDALRLGKGWAAVRRTLTLWRQRAQARDELQRMPDHRLKDLPFDTSIIMNERAKPFWKA